MSNIIKFKEPLSSYQYILSFDLAKNISGYSLVDIVNDKIISTGIINTNHNQNSFLWDYFYDEIKKTIRECLKLIGENNLDKIFIVKEKLPSQNGRFSTIDTLQTLAKTHAIFDLAATHTGIDIYDYDGVHATTVKAYFKSLLDIEKPQKEDIANYIKNKYKDFDFKDSTLDVTDSVGVTLTLINKKWNFDICEKISSLKKEKKSAKSSNKIKRIEDEISNLESLKVK